MMKKALVCGGGGFIGSHLVKCLKREGFFVRAVDVKRPDFSPTAADEFIIGDLTLQHVCENVLDQPFDEVYQLAADMGGAGYIFTGDHDADIMYNSGQINLNIARLATERKVGKILYTSSACMYPLHNQLDANNPICSESSAYPANPDSEYGWEKLFSERLYLAYARNYGLNVRIARLHNIFGPEGTWNGGKEKAPAALCRKVAEVAEGDDLERTIEIWGDGEQTRSFLYVDECLEGFRRLMDGDFTGPVNIGSEEMVTINELADMIIHLSGKNIGKRHIAGPIGVRGRCSDNRLIEQELSWKPEAALLTGLKNTFAWISDQVNDGRK